MLRVTSVTKTFNAVGKPPVRALSDVSLEVGSGQTFGLVGESGSGKSTLVRCVVRLEQPDSGQIHYEDIDALRAGGADLNRFRREVQMVFQDPYASLNPRMTVEQLGLPMTVSASRSLRPASSAVGRPGSGRA
jgi:ABC-type glutathione transport system ATPase component